MHAFLTGALPAAGATEAANPSGAAPAGAFASRAAVVPGFEAAAAAKGSCVPVLPRGADVVSCAPNFVILGAQKAATTSLFT